MKVNIYEIEQQMAELLDQMESDETGLLPENWEELEKKLDELGMMRQQKLHNVAAYILNIRADQTALKTEEKRLAERRKALENKENLLMDYLDRACGGQKTELGIATVCYRRTEKVVLPDEGKARVFLAENHHTQCLRYVPAEISKKDLKDLIKSGVEVPGAAVQEGLSCSLR